MQLLVVEANAVHQASGLANAQVQIYRSNDVRSHFQNFSFTDWKVQNSGCIPLQTKLTIPKPEDNTLKVPYINFALYI